jgi:hypothetical protein
VLLAQKGLAGNASPLLHRTPTPHSRNLHNSPLSWGQASRVTAVRKIQEVQYTRRVTR